jgi:phosphoglycolate phosphatase
MTIDAILFDKDGTLVDFHGTWDVAIGRALRVATDSPAALATAADALGYDLISGTVLRSSPFVAESNEVVFALLADHLDTDRFEAEATKASLEGVAPAVGVEATLRELQARAISCAVVTNDYESIARSQMAVLGWEQFFAAQTGSDSGFGAKPEPGMVTGTLGLLQNTAVGPIRPSNAVMVGDTSYDLYAGNAAGLHTVLVTNGVENAVEVRALAGTVIVDMSALIPALEAAGLL